MQNNSGTPETLFRFKTLIKHDTGIYLPCYNISVMRHDGAKYQSKHFVIAKLDAGKWLLCTNRRNGSVYGHIIKSYGVFKTLKSAIAAGEHTFIFEE